METFIIMSAGYHSQSPDLF